MPAPSVDLHVVRSDEVTYCRLTGTIDETFDPQSIGAIPSIAILDLGAVRSITSAGVRRWCSFIERFAPSTRVYLLRCAPCMLDQLNLVINFGGHAEVISALVHASCAQCDEDELVEIDLVREAMYVHGGQFAPRNCKRCDGLLVPEDPMVFRFLPRHAVRNIESPAARMLSVLGVYQPPVERRPLEVAKLVEGPATLIKLEGALDDRFRWRKLAVDTEGEIVVLLGGLDLLERGVESWSSLFVELRRRARHLVLVDLPVKLAQLNEQGLIDLGSAIVHSVRLPIYCATCNEFGTESVALATLQRADRVRLPCRRCGASAESIEGHYPLERLRRKYLPTPESVASIIARAGELFSVATVEARLATERPRERIEPGERMSIGGYRIIRPLSEGGMAEIFLATRPSFGGFEKPVALKRFRREMFDQSRTTLDMFLKEARISANLNHPNIVQTIDVGEDGGDLYIAMEYVEGCDLREMLFERRAAMPTEFVVYVGAQIAGALAYAHRARDLSGQPLNIIHRDVSLQNILVGFDGRVKLIDFGIALVGMQHARSNRVAGNLCYMSPEQCRGLPLDGRTDVFSLGVVLHELLSGSVLFYRPQTQATIDALLSGPIPSLPGVPPRLEQIVMRALARDRSKRFPDASALEAALLVVASELPTTLSSHDAGRFVRRMFGRNSDVMPISKNVDLPAEMEEEAELAPLREEQQQPPKSETLPHTPSLPFAQSEARAPTQPLAESAPAGGPPATEAAAPAPTVPASATAGAVQEDTTRLPRYQKPKPVRQKISPSLYIGVAMMLSAVALWLWWWFTAR